MRDTVRVKVLKAPFMVVKSVRMPSALVLTAKTAFVMVIPWLTMDVLSPSRIEFRLALRVEPVVPMLAFNVLCVVLSDTVCVDEEASRLRCTVEVLESV